MKDIVNYNVTTYLAKEKEEDIKNDNLKLHIGDSTIFYTSAFDSLEIRKLKKVETFKSDIDALNFMKENGWELVYITNYRPNYIYELGRKEIYFKKIFEKKVGQ